jgi:hypothetical protein
MRNKEDRPMAVAVNSSKPVELKKTTRKSSAPKSEETKPKE